MNRGAQVGVSGREGRQAVLASDYAVGQFRFLTRLLLVHGRWSYLRNKEVVMYAFYKNFAYCMGNVWIAFLSGFSSQVTLAGQQVVLPCGYVALRIHAIPAREW